ncbi:barstar family protein [Verrucomicrobium sp. BvORR106]|uniref:barstar family protein n=1 Tax=Verrucomicrobium sp. BvORR106 TaxID=1403819 RepID=UPI00056E512B|nr:barstar family protein [Verrucomicrobium sp. BvORR106]
MRITIDGNTIGSEADFHDALAKILDLGDFYGRNLNALWDRLTADVDRPLEIVWINASESKKNLGDIQDKIAELFRDVEAHDRGLNFSERFQFSFVD